MQSLEGSSPSIIFVIIFSIFVALASNNKNDTILSHSMSAFFRAPNFVMASEELYHPMLDMEFNSYSRFCWFINCVEKYSMT